MRRRVVITGIGAVTPLGHGVNEMFEAQLAGRSGVGPIGQFNARRFPTTFAAEVKGFDLANYLPDAGSWVRGCGPSSLFAAAAARQAVVDAGLVDAPGIDRTRWGAYLSCGEGVQDFANLVSLVAHCYQPEARALDLAAFERAGLERFCGPCEAGQELHRTAAHLADLFGLEGPNYNCLTACAASSQAVGEAAELIRCGDADLMLAGGAHSMIHPFGVAGFNRLTALSTRNDAPHKASRPFDLHRDGFVLGEGAGMLVLEELEHARRRDAAIHAELTGYGSTADAFAVTESHPEGRGASACMRAALKDAGLAPAAVDYVNAHGTSTKVNDRVETLAIKTVFGDHAYRTPVSSSKSMLGHLIAASGAVELITCIEAIRRAVVPPTINYEAPDPDCDLDYVPNVARECVVRHALSNSFGFGGQNVSLIVSRFLR
jgi:3-oxoacyl-[acyl-carrier-protein] synthase II